MTNLRTFGHFQSQLQWVKSIDSYPHFSQPMKDSGSRLNSVCMNQDMFSVATTGNGLLSWVYQRGVIKPIPVSILEQFVSVKCGYCHFLALTRSGNVYSFATDDFGYKFGQLGIDDSMKFGPKTFHNLKTPTRIKYFGSPPDYNKESEEQSKSKITSFGPAKEIACGPYVSMVLLEDQSLYTFGRNCPGDLYVKDFTHGVLGQGNNQKAWGYVPVKIADNVKRVWGGFGFHSFYLENFGSVYGWGCGESGRLGTGNVDSHASPVLISSLNSYKVKDMAINAQGSFALTTDGTLLSTGKRYWNGRKTLISSFTPIPFFQKKKIPIRLISGGLTYIVLLDEFNSFWIFGIKETVPRFGKTKGRYVKCPYNLKAMDKVSSIIACPQFCCFALMQQDVISRDFAMLYEQQNSLLESEIHGIRFHRGVFECRARRKLDNDMLSVLANFSKSHVQQLLQWMYSDFCGNEKLLFEICAKIGIKEPSSRSLSQDLKLAWKNEDSKDFSIIVEEDESEDPEEFRVHKFVLQARSGMFRDLFLNVGNETNSVKDYKNISCETMDFLLKFFYTNELTLTADDDPELIVEELGDAIEYYQLSESSELKDFLSNLIKQNDIY
ncbi:regulator of chromosome condensation [Anaeramoeba flamelloides]|uniref:Regulator of chromosome condensation n=1 Tax=Anaeramoeba flamelloides TaxID=1746091 RepID=A0ABQ8XVJ1_9EUKA|nr:regulator of chromosome condensation [Anaeramoeba flamelloides]